MAQPVVQETAAYNVSRRRVLGYDIMPPEQLSEMIASPSNVLFLQVEGRTVEHIPRHRGKGGENQSTEAWWPVYEGRLPGDIEKLHVFSVDKSCFQSGAEKQIVLETQGRAATIDYIIVPESHLTPSPGHEELLRIVKREKNSFPRRA